MEFINTINLPEKNSNNKNLPKKISIKGGIKKKLREKNQYFLLVSIMILLYKKRISKDWKFY